MIKEASYVYIIISNQEAKVDESVDCFYYARRQDASKKMAECPHDSCHFFFKWHSLPLNGGKTRQNVNAHISRMLNNFRPYKFIACKWFLQRPVKGRSWRPKRKEFCTLNDLWRNSFSYSWYILYTVKSLPNVLCTYNSAFGGHFLFGWLTVFQSVPSFLSFLLMEFFRLRCQGFYVTSWLRARLFQDLLVHLIIHR